MGGAAGGANGVAGTSGGVNSFGGGTYQLPFPIVIAKQAFAGGGGGLNAGGGQCVGAKNGTGGYKAGGTGGASGGGGGAGGSTPWGRGGAGGSNGGAGSSSAAGEYGGGGGGGSGNSAGGNGSPGILWLLWFDDSDILNVLTSTLTLAGSIGKLIADNLNATVSSRSTYDGADTAGTTTLLSRIGSALTISGGKVTVGTNDDKNGYALATTPPTATQIRTEMDANSTKLANLDVAVSTRLAPSGTLATVTNLTNPPDVPTEAEIAAAVWSYVTRTITGGGITAQQVWEYVSTLLPDGAEALLAGIASRLAEQVPTGPVVVLPAPAAGQTIAWVMCYGPNGAIEAGVTISVFLTKTTEDGAFDAAAAVLTSDEDGLAQGPIPRGAGHTFKARRGTNGKLYTFAGVDADTLALPALLGSP